MVRNQNDINRSRAYFVSGTQNPTEVATYGQIGTLYTMIGPNGGTVFQKLDNGTTTNWVIYSSQTQIDEKDYSDRQSFLAELNVLRKSQKFVLKDEFLRFINLFNKKDSKKLVCKDDLVKELNLILKRLQALANKDELVTINNLLNAKIDKKLRVLEADPENPVTNEVWILKLNDQEGYKLCIKGSENVFRISFIEDQQ